MNKNILKILVSIAALCFVATTSFAEVRVGVSGAILKIDASGTEKEGTAADTSTVNKSVDNIAGVGMIHAEFATDAGYVVGFEIMPYGVDVSSKNFSRTDVTADAGETTQDDGVRSAAAEIELLRTLYVEVPVGPAYIKLGASQIDVNTQEVALTPSTGYGDATLDGYTAGLGVTGDYLGFVTKYSIEYSDFEDLQLTSGVNTLTADLDVVAFKFSIAKAF
jgi:hypothetical protein